MNSQEKWADYLFLAWFVNLLFKRKCLQKFTVVNSFLNKFSVWEVGSDGERRKVKRKLKKDEEFVLGNLHTE